MLTEAKVGTGSPGAGMTASQSLTTWPRVSQYARYRQKLAMGPTLELKSSGLVASSFTR